MKKEFKTRNLGLKELIENSKNGTRSKLLSEEGLIPSLTKMKDHSTNTLETSQQMKLSQTKWNSRTRL